MRKNIRAKATALLRGIWKIILVFILFALLLSTVLFLSLFSLLWTKGQEEKALTLEKLYIDNCDLLPSMTELDNLFTSQTNSTSLLLSDLAACENNLSVCGKNENCIEKNISKRQIKAGNTIIEWDDVRQCKSQEKGALIISYTSACELTKLGKFMDENPKFDQIPAQYINY